MARAGITRSVRRKAGESTVRFLERAVVFAAARGQFCRIETEFGTLCQGCAPFGSTDKNTVKLTFEVDCYNCADASRETAAPKVLAAKKSNLAGKNLIGLAFWYVTEPGVYSELVDILFAATFERLESTLRGGLQARDIVGAYTDQASAPQHVFAVPVNPATLTTKTRDGLTVLAKVYKGSLSVKTFANRTQASNAAAKFNAASQSLQAGVSCRWPFVVLVQPKAEQAAR